MRTECTVHGGQCTGGQSRGFLREVFLSTVHRALCTLLTLVMALALTFPARADDSLHLSAGETRTFEIRGLTAAYAVDSSVADASARGGVLTLIARGAGTTRVVVVTMDETKTLEVTIVARIVPASSRSAGGAQPEVASVETRYSSSARQFTASVDASSVSGARKTETHVIAVRTTGDRPGLAPVSFPSASYSIITPGQRLTFLDAGVDNSPLTLTGTNLRGMHIEHGAWIAHAGIVSAAVYDGLVLPAQRESVAGVSYVWSASPRLRFMPSVYVYPTKRGAVASLLARYGDGERLRVDGELGVSRGIGAALQAALNTDRNRLRASFRYSPRNFAGAGPNDLRGLYADGAWSAIFSPRVSASAAASVNHYMLPNLEQRSDTANAEVRVRATEALSLIGGANFGDFAAISPRGEHVHSFVVPAGFSLDFAHAGVTALARFGAGSLNGTTRGYRLSGRASLGRFTASAYVDRQVDAPTLQLVFRERPDLALALEQLGLTANSPQQIAELLRDNAALINLGFIDGATVDLSLLKTQSGLDLAWSSGGVARDEIRLRLLRNRAEHVSFSAQSDIAMLSYSRRLGATTMQFTLSEWTTGSGNGETRDRSVDISMRRAFDGLPHFGGGAISGVVFGDDEMLGTASADAIGIANVELLLDGTRSTKSDSRGRYAFSNVSGGMHRVDARVPVATAYFSTSSHAEIQAGEHADFGVASTPARLAGRVVSDAGDGVANVTIALARAERRMAAVSASSGSFAIAVPPGEWRASIDRETLPAGYEMTDDAPRDIALERGAPQSIELHVNALRSVSGQLAQRGEVEVRELSRRVATDGDGRFTIRSLPAGELTLVAHSGTSVVIAHVTVPREPATLTVWTAPSPTVVEGSKVTVATATAPGRPIASESGEWVVQLGAFREQANVDDLVRRLHAAGISAQLRDAKTLTFVQLGPFASRAEAAQQSVQVASAGFDAVIVRNSNR
jgi:cell division septation protein DedD